MQFLLQVEKIRKDRQHSPVVWLSLCKPFQGMNKVISVFFFYLLPFSLKRLEPFHYYYLSFSYIFFNFQSSEQTIFLSQSPRLGHRTRPQQQPIRSVPDQTTTPDYQICLRSDYRSDHAPTPTLHHRQIRPPKSAHQIRPTRLPSLTSAIQISTAHPTSWNRTGHMHCLWVGSKWVYRALDEPCKAYFPHAFGLKFSDIFFGLTWL